jgi:hypothetical protein
MLGHESGVPALLLHANFMLSGSLDLTILKWNLESGEILFRYRGTHFINR